MLYFTPQLPSKSTEQKKTTTFQITLKNMQIALCPFDLFILVFTYFFFVNFPASLLKQLENFCQVVHFLPDSIFGNSSAAQRSAPAKNLVFITEQLYNRNRNPYFHFILYIPCSSVIAVLLHLCLKSDINEMRAYSFSESMM